MTQVGVGIAGCGDVTNLYVDGLMRHPSLKVVACADLDLDRAEALARRLGVDAVYDSVDGLVHDSNVEIVLNLTPPTAHVAVTTASLRAGKHVYSEKPLATDLVEARDLVALATRSKLRLGCAPDTVLSVPIQACRRAIADGRIGEPKAAVAFFTCHGYEAFHPAPGFFYARGGGPLLDIGPYYVSTIVTLLGSVVRVTGLTRRSGDRRVTEDGRSIAVEVPTHASATLETESGALVTVMFSWDVWASGLPFMEVYGSEGSLSVPNPDDFDGVPRIRLASPADLTEPYPLADSRSWPQLPVGTDATLGRGLGLAEMADAIVRERPHRASGELALHVLEVLLAIEESSRCGAAVTVETRAGSRDLMPTFLPGYPLPF